MRPYARLNTRINRFMFILALLLQMIFSAVIRPSRPVAAQANYTVIYSFDVGAPEPWKLNANFGGVSLQFSLVLSVVTLLIRRA